MSSISVIVPVYQAEKFLKACVESVKMQSFQDWELLLVNDGSTDSSPIICHECAREDSRIRVFHQEKNAGVSEARNRALRAAKGTCIAFLDADDQLEPHALETMWRLREQTGADTVGCAHWNVAPNGKSTMELLLRPGVYDQQGIRQEIVYPLLGDRLMVPVFNGFIWRYLFSTEILRNIGLTFEGAYLEDELFLMEYFCNAKKLAVTDQPLYRYYLNPSSATHRYMKDYLSVFTRFMERKEELARAYCLEEARPQWRENTNWAGLLIAIGNEFASGNRKSMRERRQTVRELCGRSEMAKAIAEVRPVGMTSNKQLVAKLVRGRHFWLLTQLYRIKNHL